MTSHWFSPKPSVLGLRIRNPHISSRVLLPALYSLQKGCPRLGLRTAGTSTASSWSPRPKPWILPNDRIPSLPRGHRLHKILSEQWDTIFWKKKKKSFFILIPGRRAPDMVCYSGQAPELWKQLNLCLHPSCWSGCKRGHANLPPSPKLLVFSKLEY